MSYILHVVAGPYAFLDDSGTTYPDLRVARAEAIKDARELMVHRLREGQSVWPSSCIEILDDQGLIVDVVTFEEAAFGAGLRSRYLGLYRVVHHPYLLLAPDFDILEANPAYLNATMTDLASISRRGIFDVFPDNPSDPEATGVKNLGTSLRTVLQEKRPHRMPQQRYDLRARDGNWEERHWLPVNFPVLDDNGDVAFIVHHVEDVTAQFMT